MSAYMVRLEGATHLSGTPTHWRRALMSAEARTIAPQYIRLSGEVADQGILDALRRALSARPRIVSRLRVNGSRRRIRGRRRSRRVSGEPRRRGWRRADRRGVEARCGSDRRAMAIGLVGDESPGARRTPNGFVDTGDVVERRGDRYYFLGRRSGVINVGGLKVYPEEVESAINRHPAVRMSMVRPAEVPSSAPWSPPTSCSSTPEASADAAAFRHEIPQICRGALPPHKVPPTIRIVPALDIAGGGKLARHAVG